MANNPNSPSNDPAALAFSAVENALKDSVFSLDEQQKASTGDMDAKPAQLPERAKIAEKQAAKAAAAANDDRFASSKALHSLQAPPSSAPMWIAIFVSSLWIMTTSYIGWLRFSDQLSRPNQWGVFVTTADFAGLLAITAMPVLGFFAVAILVRRAQDLRIAATSMTEAAIRLSEPETTATDKVASVGQAVRREVNALGDGLERALSRAGELEVMVHNEVTSLERTYSDNEMRLRSLIQELSAQRESVITNSDRVREAIVDAHNHMIEDLDKAGTRLSSSIVDRGDEVKQAVETAAETLNSTLGDQSGKFVSLMDNRTEELLSTISTSTEKLNVTFNDRAALVESAFDDRSSELSSMLEERLNILTGELDSRALAMSASIDEKTEGLASVLKNGGSIIIADLESRGYAMNGALEAIGTRIVTDIGDRATTAEESLSGITDRLDETMSITLNSMDSRLQSALLEINGAMGETTEQAHITISASGTETLQQINARVEEISLVIDSRLQEVDSVIGGKGERIIEALNNHTMQFSTSANLLETALVEKTTKLDEVITTKSKEISGQISARTKEFGEKLGARSQQLSDAMGTRTKEFGEVLSDRTQKLSDVLEKRTSEFGDTLGKRTQTMSDALTGETQSMAEKIKSSTDTLTDSIRTQTQEIGKTVDSQGATVRARVDDAMRTVTETMDGRATHVSTLITSKIAEVNESIGREVDMAVERISGAESGVTERIDSAAASITESAERAAKTIETNVGTARDSITDMVDRRLGTLPEAITARADITADRLTALNESINITISSSMAELEASADQIEETIGSRIASASLTISSDVEQTAARMDVAVRTALEQIREAAHHIEDLVEVRALETANQLGEKVEEMNRALVEHSDSFSTLITSRSSELRGALQNHGNILRDALSETAQESEEIMSASTSRILSDVTDALKKLNDGNLLLQRVLETSTGNLAQLESSVAQQTSSYSETVREAVSATEQAGELVTGHVTALQTTIESLVREFGGLLGNLDTETANINNAADALTNAGNFTIDTLENRRGAMEALVSSFTERADEVDIRMRAFAQSISETVTSTEARLVDARRAMEDALITTSSTVTGQLESITQSADAQGQRAGDQMRQTQQALVAEMQNALEDATRRFNETADSMRITAGQVNSELEATRSELQRGVVELPEETRASAAAMRRVVAEQIEALNELNAIVRAQPTTHDVSRRRPAPTRGIEPPRQAEPMRPAPQPERRQEPQQQRRPQEMAPPPQQPAQRFESQRDIDSRELEANVAALSRASQTPPQPRAPEPVRQAPPPQQPQPQPQRGPDAAPRDENGSWLRDVLRNASAKQQAGIQRNVNLSNLTDEVARSMDENALVEAWQRYRSGESNVFSRRIYTLTGQGTYDEVRKKLQRDADFARTATAYMDEFEQLLTNAASDPRSAAMMQDHLISDRGKVYTMLAHASGRLS